MNRSFYNGISGSRSYQFGMDTLANNIANINTVGFKAKRPEFSNLFSQLMSESSKLPTSNQIGLGAQKHATSLDLTGGSLIDADNTFDMAIGGDGWLAVKMGKETFYTRKGDFHIDANEYLADTQGAYLMGVASDALLEPDEQGIYQTKLIDSIPLTSTNNIQKIHLPTQAYLPAVPTTEVKLKGNLDPINQEGPYKATIPNDSYQLTINEEENVATITGKVEPNDEIIDPKPGDVVFVTLTNGKNRSIQLSTVLDQNLQFTIEGADIAALDPANSGPIRAKALLSTEQTVPSSGHFQSTIIGSNQEKGMVDITFTQTLPMPEEGSAWKVKASVLQFEEKLDPKKNYDPDLYKIDKNNQKVYKIIDTKEGLIKFNKDGALIENSLPELNNGDIPLKIDLGSLYDPNTPNSGYDGMTALAEQGTKLKENHHNGFVKGDLKGYSLEPDGTIFAQFTNGKTSAVARIPIFHFQNDQGLSSESNVLFKKTPNSGDPFLFTTKDGQVIQGATLLSHKLESSNVSMHTALTEMIVMQKAFDANAKSITTSDQMIQRAINLKK